MKKFFKLLLASLLLFIGATPVSAQVRDLAQIQESGKIIMGTNADFPPFEWTIMKDGEPVVVGIDADIAEKIAEEVGVELEILDTSFDSLIQNVKSGKVDFIMSGITETEERAKQVDFSDNYYTSASKFLIRIEDSDKYTKKEDFEKVKIGVQKATMQEANVLEAFPEADVVSMDKNSDIIQALITKRVDAVVFDGIVVEEFVVRNADKIMLVEDLQIEDEEEGFSVATAPGNTELMEKINKVINELVDSGEISEIFTKNQELNAEGANN